MSSNNGNGRLAERFAQRLRKARLEAGLTQEQLANLTGIKYTQLSSYENGHHFPGFRTLRDLCIGLGVDGNYLLVRRGR